MEGHNSLSGAGHGEEVNISAGNSSYELIELDQTTYML